MQTVKVIEIPPPRLMLQEVVPFIELPYNQGKNVNLWQYKQRKNLVLVFYHEFKCPICQRKLKEFTEIYGDVQGLDAEILAISQDSLKDIQDYAKMFKVPFPLLSDPDGKTMVRYTYKDDGTPLPALFITDRYGALYYQRVAREANDLPPGKEVVSWLFYIECQCPECSHL